MRAYPHPIRWKLVVGVGLAPTHTQGQPQGLPVQQSVIPAKAGIHAIYPSARSWIPAFAGMTI
jgi:hypothetical protein